MELKKLAMTILATLAKALKMESKEMEVFFEDGMQRMRMNYYPPCPEPEKVIGLTPHSDATGLTILFQVNGVEGLRVKKDGNWVLVKPLPNAFIVNVGDMLEVIGNGQYRSVEHRAIVNSAKERLSITTFYNARYNGEIGPAQSLVSEQNPAMYKRVTVEFFEHLFAHKFDGKYFLDAMKIGSGE